MQKLRYMSRNSEYVNRGIKIDVSDSEWNRSKCLDCIEVTMHTVTSHRSIDHSNRVRGKYWGVDTTGQQDAAILSGNRYKTTFVEFVTCFIVNFYHANCEESSILEIIRRFDNQILGIIKSQGTQPIFLR